MAHGRSPKHVRRPRAERAPRRPERVAPTSTPTPAGSMRVQKILAAAGVASRRGAEEMIRQGRVSVNGKPIEIGASADPGLDTVMLDGERVRLEPPRYWILNKPRGIVTTLSDPHGRRTVRELVPMGAGRVYPVGRLDRDSSGLVLLTNDGALTQRLLHPSRESEKEYRVTVKGELDERTIGRLRRGIHLEDGPTKPTRVERVRFDPDDEMTTFHLVLTEGRKRQIRRMMLLLGHPVKRLVRVRLGPLRLGRLAPGANRPLRGDEVRALRAYVAKLEQSQPASSRGGAKRPGPGAGVRPSRPGKAAGRRRPTGSRA